MIETGKELNYLRHLQNWSKKTRKGEGEFNLHTL